MILARLFRMGRDLGHTCQEDTYQYSCLEVKGSESVVT